jgi:hypothetical protein
LKKKSPLKAKPLRYVGQSLDEEIDQLINEDAIPYLLVCFLLVYFAAYEWWRFYKNPEPSPILTTSIAILFIIYSFYKIKKILNRVKSLKLGRDGERAVGQYLEGLRENGHRVFHDLLGENFNIDHIVISQKGIFLIETKTYSKPIKGESKIFFDGKKLSIQNAGIHTKPITQVLAASKWLNKILLSTTGKNFPVKPVILFPGWFVTSSENGKKSGIWVLEPKALPKYIENQSVSLSQEDMMLASYHISRYIRTKEVKR